MLDLSGAALKAAKARLGARADRVHWLVADATIWEPVKRYDIWHDRAAFHFLTDENDRAAYIERLTRGLKAGGHAIIATFALDGPEKCSGLPVARYDAASLGQTLGPGFRLVHTRRHEHATPGTPGRSSSSAYSGARADPDSRSARFSAPCRAPVPDRPPCSGGSFPRRCGNVHAWMRASGTPPRKACRRRRRH